MNTFDTTVVNLIESDTSQDVLLMQRHVLLSHFHTQSHAHSLCSLWGQGRLAVPNSNSPNLVPHVQHGVEIEPSEMRTARELWEQA